MAISPNYYEQKKRLKQVHELTYLLEVVEGLRWNFAARFFKTFNFLTRSDTKISDVLVESSIRTENIISPLNVSSPLVKDFQPIELLFQWKDGYIIMNNKFIGVTIWDAFAIVANMILMLERAWLTWGRLCAKLVRTRAQFYLDQYEENSPEWKLVKSILDRNGNLISAAWAIRKMNKVALRLERLQVKRKLEKESQARKAEHRRRKYLKYSILRGDVCDPNLTKIEEKRIIEWETYKKLLKERAKYRERLDELVKTEEIERINRISTYINRTGYASTVTQKSDSSKSSSTGRKRHSRKVSKSSSTSIKTISSAGSDDSESYFADEQEFKGQIVNASSREPILRKTTRMQNCMFQVKEGLEKIKRNEDLDDEIDFSHQFTNPWSEKYRQIKERTIHYS